MTERQPKSMFRLPTIAGCYSEQITNQNKKGVYKCPEHSCLYSYVWTRF